MRGRKQKRHHSDHKCRTEKATWGKIHDRKKRGQGTRKKTAKEISLTKEESNEYTAITHRSKNPMNSLGSFYWESDSKGGEEKRDERENKPLRAGGRSRFCGVLFSVKDKP